MTTTKKRPGPVRKRTEKDVEHEIVIALRTMGFAVTKTSQPRASMVTLGLPDLYASHATWGIRAWIEVKAGKNKPSTHQLLWHEQERAAGGLVIVAYNVRDVLRELVAAGAPIQGVK